MRKIGNKKHAFIVIYLRKQEAPQTSDKLNPVEMC